jgi:predicted PurR-regulated permease PerM
MRKLQLAAFLVILLLLFIPLTHATTIAVPGQDPSPVDDFSQWLDNAIEDIRTFFDNLGENLSRALETMFGSIRNFGEALGDQLGEAVEGIRQE